MSNIPELNAWRELRIDRIPSWSARVLNALKPHYDTLGELADTPMMMLRRHPNVGMIAINEIRQVIAQAVVCTDFAGGADPADPAGIAMVSGTPTCATCRWWGHDSAAPWVVSPKSPCVNVCGVHRQEHSRRPSLNIITEQNDWCGEHAWLPISDAAAGQ